MLEAIPIKERLLQPGREHNRPGSLITPTAIVVHRTADFGATALNIRNWFNRGQKQVSSQYILDRKELVRCIPEWEMAWHAGGVGNNPNWHEGNPNRFAIGIEVCEDYPYNADTSADHLLPIILTDVALRWSIPLERVWRHSDVDPVDKPNCPGNLVDWPLLMNSVEMLVDYYKPLTAPIMHDGKPKWLATLRKGMSFGYFPGILRELGHAVEWRDGKVWV